MGNQNPITLQRAKSVDHYIPSATNRSGQRDRAVEANEFRRLKADVLRAKFMLDDIVLLCIKTGKPLPAVVAVAAINGMVSALSASMEVPS